MYKLINILTLIILVIFFTSCKKIKNNQPCFPNQQFEAGFKLGYKFLDGTFVESDTIINYSVSMMADTTYESYLWKIGNDPTLHHTREVNLSFSLSDLGKSIPVTLIAKGQKVKCNPNDDGIDTVHKNFKILYSKEIVEYKQLNYPTSYLTFGLNLPVFGRWKGSYSDNTNDSFIVTINYNGLQPSGGTDKFYGFRIYNFPKGCSVKQQSGIATCEPTSDSIQKYFGYPIEELSYNGFNIQPQSFLQCCPLVLINGSLDTKTGIISINCNFIESKISKIFKGKKI